MIATIVKHQWFSGSPLPLNEWFGRNHWYQWFFNGFWSINHWPRCFFSLATIGLDGFAMVFGLATIGLFNGSQPLVKRWNGNDPSLRSSGCVGHTALFVEMNAFVMFQSRGQLQSMQIKRPVESLKGSAT